MVQQSVMLVAQAVVESRGSCFGCKKNFKRGDFVFVVSEGDGVALMCTKCIKHYFPEVMPWLRKDLQAEAEHGEPVINQLHQPTEGGKAAEETEECQTPDQPTDSGPK